MTTPPFHPTDSLLEVLAVLVDGERQHGPGLARQISRTDATVYSVLHTLEECGWADSAEEASDERGLRPGPPRRYYWLREEHVNAARKVLRHHQVVKQDTQTQGLPYNFKHDMRAVLQLLVSGDAVCTSDVVRTAGLTESEAQVQLRQLRDHGWLVEAETTFNTRDRYYVLASDTHRQAAQDVLSAHGPKVRRVR